jgi:(S)-sulfolactate dehydrogenase
MKIIVSEFMEDTAVDHLRQNFDVLYDESLVDNSAKLKKLLIDADALIVRNRTQVSADLLLSAPILKAVGRLGVGLDNIDLIECEKRSIKVLPAVGANAQAVAEYVITAMMLLLRGAFMSSDSIGKGFWPRADLSNGHEISGKIMGLVGFGNIGQLTAKLAQGLGMKVVAFDPAITAQDNIWQRTGVESRSLGSLVEQSDVISLHVPLIPSTQDLFNADLISQMKSSAVLINTARGGIVNEEALATALKNKTVFGAALDVFVTEPLGSHSPLAGIHNVLLTPHIAGLTVESNQRVSKVTADRVTDYLINQ